MRSMKGILIVVAVASLTVATQVHAGIITDLVFVGSVDLLGATGLLVGQGGVRDGVDDHDVYELVVMTDTSWLNNDVFVELVQGKIFQHPFGSFDPPNTALLPAFPELAFDTYFEDPLGNAVGDAGSTETDNSIVAAVFDKPADGFAGPGTYTLLHLTVSRDAIGTVHGLSYDVDTAGLGVPFSFGIPIPEPASLALMMVGGLMVLKRQRRSMN